MKWNRSELWEMATRELRNHCRRQCKTVGISRTWVNTASKAVKVAFLLMDEQTQREFDGSTLPEMKEIITEDKNKDEYTIKTTFKPQKSSSEDGLTDMLANLVSERIGGNVEGIIKDSVREVKTSMLEQFDAETSKTKKYVDGAIATLRKPIQVHIDGIPAVTIEEMTHEAFPEVLECLKHFGRVWLCGPSGTGKSFILEQCAKALGYSKDNDNYVYVKGGAGVTESHLTGRMTFDGEFVDGQVSSAFRDGKFLCLDEFDGFDANCGLVFNSVFDNQGILATPNDREHPMVLKNDNFIVGVASNTWGDGQDFNYVGRGQLDLATLDRLNLQKFEIDYDKNIERALSGDYIDMANMLWDLRSRTFSNSVSRIISTRLFVDGQKWRKLKKSNADILDKITVNWTNEERLKVNVKELKSLHRSTGRSI